MGADPAVRVTIPTAWAEIAGALLYERLGPFQELGEGERRHLIFYPFRHGAGFVEDEEILAPLPEELRALIFLERVLVPGGWEDSWKIHFKPIVIRHLAVRPPWEPPVPHVETELVLTPGLAFGTGLHPTTRGILLLLQDGEARGPLVDVGTGSGILALAGHGLGFAPIRAVDNDPIAVEAARANAGNHSAAIEVQCHELEDVPLEWFWAATVLANITLEPVSALLERLKGLEIRRLLVAGILSGEQEFLLEGRAREARLRIASRLYEHEWVAFDLRPQSCAAGEKRE